MENSELNQLIELLDNPSVLQQKIDVLNSSTNLTDEIEGFIIVYNLNKGDCTKIKKYLIETKTKIETPLKKKNLFSTYLKSAAIFLILLGIGALLFNKQKNEVPLLHQFKEPGLSNYMSASSSSNWEDIMFDFKTKNYPKAKLKINKELIKSPTNDTLIYFLGIIEFELKNLKDAKIQLQKLRDSTKSIYNKRSIYYLGLIEYKRTHLTSANTIFKLLSSSTDIDVRNASFEHVNEIQSKLK